MIYPLQESTVAMTIRILLSIGKEIVAMFQIFHLVFYVYHLIYSSNRSMYCFCGFGMAKDTDTKEQ